MRNNAISAVAEHRQEEKSGRQTQISANAALLEEQAEIGKKREQLGWITGGQDAIIFTRNVEQLKLKPAKGSTTPIYKRSGDCADTNKADSLALCDDLKREQAKLDAALKIEGYDGRLQGIREKLAGSLAGAPEVADVRLQAVAGFLGEFVTIDARKLDIGYPGALAIMLELAAAFFPMFWRTTGETPPATRLAKGKKLASRPGRVLEVCAKATNELSWP